MKKLLLVGIFGALSSLSQAASVTIQNPSFESPDLTGGGATWSNDLAPGGGWLNQDNTPSSGSSFIEAIGGFSADGAQHIGMESGWGIGQDTGIMFEADTRYILLIAAGNRNTNFTVAGNASQYGFVDGIGGTYASATFDAFAGVTEGSFGDAPALVFDIPAGSPLIGEPVIIGLASAGPGRAHFDNVRLDAGAIPEPTSGLLAGLAGLMLLRRKR